MSNIESVAVTLVFLVGCALCCGFPGSPAHSKVVTTDDRFMEGTVVTFECDPGYKLLGPQMLRCVNSEWDSHGLPYCVRELAFAKPSGMLSRKQTPNLAVDGQVTTCTETDEGNEHLWWLDLIEPVEVDVVETHFGVDLGNVTIEVIVEDTRSNTTSTCIPSTDFATRIGEARYLSCDGTVFGNKLTINVSAKHDFSFQLCEVRVYSQGVLSPQDACGPASKGKIESLQGQCYEVTPNEATFEESRNFCKMQGGTLWKGQQRDFVSWMMNVHNLDSVWYENEEASANSTPANCAAFSKDELTDRNPTNQTCMETRFGLCVRLSQSCGKPKLPKRLASWSKFDKVRPGETSEGLECEKGFHLSGPPQYHCLKSGNFLSQTPTACRQSPCGEPPKVVNAFPVLDSQQYRYQCLNDSFVLYGNSNLTCDPLTSKWATPHLVCVRLTTSSTYTVKSLRARLLQGADLFPVATKFGLVLFIIALVIIKILVVIAVVNLVRYFKVIKPKLERKHNSSVLLTSMHIELSREASGDRDPIQEENNNNLAVVETRDLELSSGDAQVVTRNTGSSTPKAPETPKMKLNESSIREPRTD